MRLCAPAHERGCLLACGRWQWQGCVLCAPSINVLLLAYERPHVHAHNWYSTLFIRSGALKVRRVQALVAAMQIHGIHLPPSSLSQGLHTSPSLPSFSPACGHGRATEPLSMTRCEHLLSVHRCARLGPHSVGIALHSSGRGAALGSQCTAIDCCRHPAHANEQATATASFLAHRKHTATGSGQPSVGPC